MQIKKDNKWINVASIELLQTVLKLKNLNEATKFFRDLLSEAELKEFSNRWKAARMLSIKIPFKQIESETGMSPNTISRINKWLKKGTGGYSTMLKRQ